MKKDGTPAPSERVAAAWFRDGRPRINTTERYGYGRSVMCQALYRMRKATGCSNEQLAARFAGKEEKNYDDE